VCDEVGGDAGGAAEIVQGELGDEGVHLQEQGQGLADAARGAEDRDLWEGFAWERGQRAEVSVCRARVESLFGKSQKPPIGRRSLFADRRRSPI
jgi:hypothetical protein